MRPLPRPVPPPPAHAPVPAELRVSLDPWVRREGATLLGGEPFALIRLTPAHADLLDRLQGGAAVGDDPGEVAFVRGLLSAAVFVPETSDAGRYAPADVTVVIPVRDRPGQLSRLLAALGDVCARVIVVDDASSDAAAHADVARAAGAELVRRPVRGGPAAARNDGLRRATTPLVAFIDSDCVPLGAPGEWLTPLLAQFADPLVAAAAPRIVGSVGSEGWLGDYQRERSAMDRGDLPGLVQPGGRVPFVPTAAVLVRREAAGSGFDEAMAGGEDVDFIWRLSAAGWQVRYVPARAVAHDHPVRVGEWAAQRVSYGRSAAELALRHPRAGRPLAISPWTAAAWGAAAVLPPVLGAVAWTVVTSTATALLERDLRPTLQRPWREALALAAGGTVRAGRDVADTMARLWWPALAAAGLVSVLVRGRRGHRPLATLALAAAWSAIAAQRSSAASREPVPALPWIAAKVLDDLAYGAGVWWGCARQRTLAPLLPDLGWRMRVVDSHELR